MQAPFVVVMEVKDAAGAVIQRFEQNALSYEALVEFQEAVTKGIVALGKAKAEKK